MKRFIFAMYVLRGKAGMRAAKRIGSSIMLVTLLLSTALSITGCAQSSSAHNIYFASVSDINLGDDTGSRTAAIILHVMQTTDRYFSRLNRLQFVPDTSDKRLAAEEMRAENLLYNTFISEAAAAIYNARPITGSGYKGSFEQIDGEIIFSITTIGDVVYEGKLDENAKACYIFRYEEDDMQFCKFIADKNGYYIELIAKDVNSGWLVHRAYYSGNKWLCARAKLDGEPNPAGDSSSSTKPDLAYHYLPYDFEHFVKSLSPLIIRAEYYHGDKLTYWDFARGWELTWQLSNE